MKKLLMTIAATALLGSTAHADERFLKAAAFFLSGHIDQSLQYGSTKDGSELVVANGAITLQDKSDPCIVYFFDAPSAAMDVRMHGPKLMTMNRVDFNKMPSPRDFGSDFVSGIGGRMWSWGANLPRGAMTEVTARDDGDGSMAFSPTGKYWKTFQWSATNTNETGFRRLGALNMIRANYCSGAPEIRGY